MSVTALLGTNAQFNCAGTAAGNHLAWCAGEVDGLASDHYVARGITVAWITP